MKTSSALVGGSVVVTWVEMVVVVVFVGNFVVL